MVVAGPQVNSLLRFQESRRVGGGVRHPGVGGMVQSPLGLENRGLADRYRVMSIPTLMVFSGGAAQKSLFGAIPKRKLIEELK